MLCALWVPETTFRDAVRMDVVIGADRVSKARQQLLCTVCKQPYGACIQCAGASFVAF